METEPTLADKLRATLQWWRVPIIAALVAAGILVIRQETVWLWAGMGITLVGEAIQLWSASHLRKDELLVTSGPYSHVRNPMYFGRFFVGLGFTVMIQIPVLLAAYVVLFVLYAHARVGREEARLHSIFGDDYARYCSEVPRWLPRVRSYSQAAAQRCQWSRIAANHEYLNLLVVLVVFAIILVRIRCF